MNSFDGNSGEKRTVEEVCESLCEEDSMFIEDFLKLSPQKRQALNLPRVAQKLDELRGK